MRRELHSRIDSLLSALDANDLISAGIALDHVMELEYQFIDFEAVFKREVKRAGWKFYGAGVYSFVIGRDGQPFVFKLNHEPDDPMPMYAEYAMKNQHENPMLPVIHGMQQSPGGLWVVRMEKLEPANVTASVGMSTVVNMLINARITKAYRTWNESKQKIRWYVQNWFDITHDGTYSVSNLARIVWWVAGVVAEHGYHPDFHGRNWMLRNKQLVLIDPIG